jgi:capsular exopolysaccharide synthesis family protein
MYAATATLIIKDEKKGNDDSKLMESLNMINNKKIIENEIEVLKSRLLMNQVVSNLHLYARMYTKGKLKTRSAYTSSPVYLEVKDPLTISDTNNIRIIYNTNKETVQMGASAMMPIGQWTSSTIGVIRFMKNPNYIPANAKDPLYLSLTHPKEIVNEILEHLSVNAANKLSSVINLTYKDENAQKAEDILNQLLLVYDNTSINEKNNLARNTLQFVEERLHSVAQDLDSIEQNVQLYKTVGGASDIGTEGQLYLQNVSSNDQRLGEINVQLAVLNQINDRIKDGQKANGSPSPLGISDPTLGKMLLDLNDKELEYEKLKKTVAENNPLLISIKDQINKIKPAIAENVSGQINNLETSKNKIEHTNNQYNSLLSRIPQKEKKLLEMSRDESIKKGIYAFLLEKREESELSYASTISDSRVINQAQSTERPVSPNKPIIYLSSFLLSLLTTGMAIGSIDLFSNKVLDKNQLMNLTRQPVIGEIGYIKGSSGLHIKKGIRSYLTESFKKINLSLTVMTLPKKLQTILVTSSIPGEGKSFVTANLGIINAHSKKKTVIVDWDPHQSGLTKRLGIEENALGVTDYLEHQALITDIIHPSNNHSNLFIVPSGKRIMKDNINSQKAIELLQYLQNHFELILIDTAPIESMADAYLLANYCDTTLFVVRHQYTPANLIKELDQKMAINPLPQVGIVFNGVKATGLNPKKYGYGYHYNQ